MSEQGVPLITSNQIKQMKDWDILVFHHDLPAFHARRMNWMEHPLLREREAMKPPPLEPLPSLTPIELRSANTLAEADVDDPINPGDFE